MADQHNKADVEAAFLEVRTCLARMSGCLDGESIDMLALAKAYAALTQSMVVATRAGGQTSIRFDAAAKALDLTTPKSALTRFVKGD